MSRRAKDAGFSGAFSAMFVLARSFFDYAVNSLTALTASTLGNVSLNLSYCDTQLQGKAGAVTAATAAGFPAS